MSKLSMVPEHPTSNQRDGVRKLALPAFLMLVTGALAVPHSAKQARGAPVVGESTGAPLLLSTNQIQAAVDKYVPGALSAQGSVDYVLLLIDSRRNVISTTAGHGDAELAYGGDSSGRCVHWVHVDDASRVATSADPGIEGADPAAVPDGPITGSMQLLLAPQPGGRYAPASWETDMRETDCAAGAVTSSSGFAQIAPYEIKAARGQHFRSGDLGARPLDVIVAVLKR